MSAPLSTTQFYYAVFCAWCHEVISYSTVEHSSGICQDCAGAMRAHARALGIINPKEAKNQQSKLPNLIPAQKAS